MLIHLVEDGKYYLDVFISITKSSESINDAEYFEDIFECSTLR